MNVLINEKEFTDWLIALRRYFHQYPELSFNEFNTQEMVIEVLNSLGIENSRIAGTGVVAMIRGGKQGKTIALRSDMDALKIQEEISNLNQSYISLNKGVMHACGHDGHMAMVLGAARKLHEHKENLKGNVKLIFQPAEEVPPGGAVEVIRMVGLAEVDAILGAHLFTNIKSGEICLRGGVLMASNCKYDIEITGKSGHHFNPDDTIDPILIASEFISTIQSKLKKTVPPNVSYVYGQGSIKGGEQFNQTLESVTISGSYRLLDKKSLHVIEDTMKRNLDGLMKRHSKGEPNLPKYQLDVTYGYPALVNDDKFTQRVGEVLKGIFPQINENIDSVFASEDFAYYLEKLPGTYFFLGSGNAQKGIIYGNHSNKFDIDEAVLIKGVEVFFSIATDFLNTPDKYLK